MARTDAAKVKEITGLTIDDSSIDPFINAANALINKVAAKCPDLSDEDLENAETWLAAHLLVLSPVGKKAAQVKSERFENWQKSFKTGDDSGSGIMSTSYGQMANTFTCGCLVELDKRRPSIDFAGGA